MGELNGGVSARMNDLKLDQASGFLISSMNGKGNSGVTVEDKIKFLETYRSTGNFEESARISGVNARTMRFHLHNDEKFKEEFDDARDAICDRAEGFIVEHMARPSNVIDRLSFLRAYRPKVWNNTANNAGQSVNIQINGVDNARQIVEGKRLNVEGGSGVQSAVRSDGSSNTIDTTATPLTPVNNAIQADSPANLASSVKPDSPVNFSPMPTPFASAWPVDNSEKIKRADPNHIPPPSNRSRASRVELDPD